MFAAGESIICPACNEPLEDYTELERFSEGDDLHLVYNSDCDNTFHYTTRFILANNFSLVKKIEDVHDYPYHVYQSDSDKNIYIEFVANNINIILNKKGDFIAIGNDFYALLGVLIDKKILSLAYNLPKFNTLLERCMT